MSTTPHVAEIPPDADTLTAALAKPAVTRAAPKANR